MQFQKDFGLELKVLKALKNMLHFSELNKGFDASSELRNKREKEKTLKCLKDSVLPLMVSIV